MKIENFLFSRLVAAALLLVGSSPLVHSQEEEPLPRRILKWSPADQITWLNSYLAAGMPVDDTLVVLVLSRSSIVLPVLEKKIEETIHSVSPRDLFDSPSIDPQRVIGIAASMIAYAGDAQALQEESKLMKIDEKRFGDLVRLTLFHANNRGNSFTLAYRGFEIGDPAMDTRIAAYVKERVEAKQAVDRGTTFAAWAEAIVEQHDGVPNANQWARDPIASRLEPVDAADFHREMIPLMNAAAKKRPKK
jgi:hypothetical protein